MKYSVCIDMMYADTDFDKRIMRAKNDGADAVEFWKWSNKDIDAIIRALDKSGLALSLLNLDSSDESLSQDLSRGILVKNRADELIEAINESAPVMKRLGVDNAIILAGEELEGLSYSDALANIESCLRAALPALEKNGINLLLEPLNYFDRKNYLLWRASDAFKIIRSINSPRVRLLYDIYHAQRTEGNIINTVSENIDLIGHFHIANSPYRCEPDLGELDYAQILRTISELGYDGYAGFEFRQRSSDFSLEKYISNHKYN
ncbi:MAG: TIM barrel protein [Clostridia bacterium]|nr:TIM barrel protein [Clostridia bacterium]